MQVSAEELSAFYTCYILGWPKDYDPAVGVHIEDSPHTKFAALLNIPRHEAKVLAFKLMYIFTSSACIKQFQGVSKCTLLKT